MKNSLIIVLVIVLLAIGWVLYFFRDNIKRMYDDKSPDAQQQMVDVKENIQDTVQDVKKDIVEWVNDLQK